MRPRHPARVERYDRDECGAYIREKAACHLILCGKTSGSACSEALGLLGRRVRSKQARSGEHAPANARIGSVLALHAQNIGGDMYPWADMNHPRA